MPNISKIVFPSVLAIQQGYTKEEIDSLIAGALHYKGTVDTLNDLPTENNKIGDMWDVRESGANYAWNGESWDKLSEIIDLTRFYTKDEVDEKEAALQQDINDKYDDLTNDIDDLAGTVDDLDTRVTNIAADLEKSIEDNVVALQAEDDALQQQINAHSEQLTAEQELRIGADTSLQNQINDLYNGVDFGHSLDYSNNTLTLKNLDGDELSSVTIETVPSVDGTTLAITQDSELQSIGTALQSGGVQHYWSGTKAEYNALETKDPNTIYEILDDEETALFEVDGTTIEFNSNNELQIQNKIDFVIEDSSSITAASGYGYRKWRSGYMEQWGIAQTSSTGEGTFNMSTSFKDTNYMIFVEPRQAGDLCHYAYPQDKQNFKARIQNTSGAFIACQFQWRAYGYYK